jgi:L-malate glycosyltransferase
VKICFIADANSVHARRWISYFCKPENEIHILSTRRNPRPIDNATVYDLYSGKIVAGTGRRFIVKNNPSLILRLKQSLGYRIASSTALTNVLTTFSQILRALRLAGTAKSIVNKINPGLVHCLKLPSEGYLGKLVGYHPFIISSWGNDFVFFAKKYWPLRWMIMKAMREVDAYISDTIRDKYISSLYGFSPQKPVLVMPVIGGLKLEEFPAYRKPKDSSSRERIGIKPEQNLLIMTRDFKSPYANTQAIVEAMPQITKEFPDTDLVMIGDIKSLGCVQLKSLAVKLKIEEHVRFIGKLQYHDFVDYLTASDIFISAGTYDGCPASMLESMACGLVPVMTDDYNIQEWITDGWNGYLFNPWDAGSIAQAVIRALKNKAGFATIRGRNWDILAERADYHKNMKIAEEFYRRVIERHVAQR